MSLVRILRTLASQRPSKPSRAVAHPSRVERHRRGHVPVTWIDRHLSGRATIVHLHGGAYVAGESPQAWSWLEEVSRRSGAAGCMIHYRLAPRHPFPTAIEDVLHALEDLSVQAVLRPGRWVLSGDEAGAGLALAVAQVLSRSAVGAPAALLLESPWADLTGEDHGDELRDMGARLYAGPVDRTEARLSPLLGTLDELPPVHLVTGARDPLVEHSRRLEAKFTAAGAEHEYLELPHVGDRPAIHGEGPTAQRARRFQIDAARTAMGFRQAADAAH